jgi:hypothetical protein
MHAFLKVSVQRIFVWLLLLLLPADAATRLPSSAPLRFGIDKSVELPAELTRYRNYYVDIVFRSANAQQRIATKKIAGEPSPICKALNDCGVMPSFLVTIRAGADIVLKEERTPAGYYSHGSNEFYRNILIAPLRPGNYTIIVEITQSPDEMSDTAATIEVSTDARESDLRN